MLDAEILKFIQKGPSKHVSFESLALHLFDYQYRFNRHYRKFCDVGGKSPRTVRDWREIPAMPTEGFKELVLTAFPPRKAVRIFKTSGTTAVARGAHFFDTLKLYDAAIVPVFKKYVMPDLRKIRLFFLMSSPKEAPDSSLSYMMGVVNRHFAAKPGRFYVRKGKEESEALFEALCAVKKEKVLLLATAFSLKGFLDYLKEKRATLSLPKGSRLMETGGFKGRAKEISKAALYAGCEKRLGISKDFCVSEYGMTELSSQCYDTTLADRVAGIKRKPFKKGPFWMRTLVIDPRTNKEAKKGSIGILRHFDLANYGSVMAVQTEDLGRVVGDGFELLGRAPESELRGCSLTYEEFLLSS